MFNVKIEDLKKGNKKMNETENKKQQEQTNKKSYVCYVYGQIYSGYLNSGKQTVFLIENVHVQEWRRILNWLKKNNHIADYALGDTIENAAKVVVKGFNENNKIYTKYLLGVEKNLKAA